MKIDLFGINSARAFIITSTIVAIAISIAKCSGIDNTKMMEILDTIQRRVKLKDDIRDNINDYIIKNPELLDKRIKRDIDYAIQQYENYERKNYKPNMKNEVILKEIDKSKYTWTQKIIVKDAVYYEFKPDGSEAQKLLGPTMGIRGIWVEPDPREVES